MGEPLPLYQPEEAGAEFSLDRVYRYRLWRHWDRSRGHVLWCMLNPSTADETQLDPTLRRCAQYSRDWGYGGFEVVNLFAFRATDPKVMRAMGMDAIGELNRDVIRESLRWTTLVVAGWGVLRTPEEKEHAEDILGVLMENKVYCLGTNADGSPKHPLYLRADLKPVRFA